VEHEHAEQSTVYLRKLKLIAKFDSGSSYFSMLHVNTVSGSNGRDAGNVRSNNDANLFAARGMGVGEGGGEDDAEVRRHGWTHI